MTYMRVDVGFPGCLKAIRAGGDALWMWLSMKAYAKMHGTDGFVPGEKIGRLDGPKPSAQKRLVRALIDAKGESGKHGLVDVVPGGYQLHDYLDHEESAEQAEQKRAAARERKQRYDAKHRPKTNAVRNAVTDSVTNSELTPALPNQAKPNQIDPPNPPAGGSEDGCRTLSAEDRPEYRAHERLFHVGVEAWGGWTDAQHDRILALGRNPEREAENFRNYWKAEGKRLKDWTAKADVRVQQLEEAVSRSTGATPPSELTGIAKKHAEALAGHMGPDAKRLAEHHRNDHMGWKYAWDEHQIAQRKGQRHAVGS